MLTKQEKLVLMFLLVTLTFGLFAIVYKNKLMESGITLKEIKHKVVFQADANSELLEHSSASKIIQTATVEEKSKEPSNILININEPWKGELVKLPSIESLTS